MSPFFGFAVVLSLYWVKASIFGQAQNSKVDWQFFLLSVGLCVPITWALFPGDWSTNFVFATYISNPIAVLALPCMSFLLDWRLLLKGGNPVWTDRHSWEILFGVPVWFILWSYFCAFGLGLLFI